MGTALDILKDFPANTHAEWLAAVSWRFGDLVVGHYQLLFLVSVAVHAPALGLLRAPRRVAAR